jgi:hypothetical protein
MSTIKRLAMCSLAVLALSALSASAASAASPAWWVAGTLLKAGEKDALAEATNVTKAFVFKNSTVTIECPSMTLQESAIEGEKTRTDKSIVLKGCKDVTNPSCTVATIATKPLTAALEGTAGALTLKFKPTSGTEVATITVSGTGCTASLQVTGTMVCEYPEFETEQAEHKLQFTGSSGSSVKIGGVAGEFTGSDGVKLASGKDWSAR